MESNEIIDRLRSVAPRCIALFSARPTLEPVLPRGNLATAWSLQCQCGSTAGAILGYFLGDLKPGFEASAQMVSPLDFACKKCGDILPIIDTAIHGTASEGARLEGNGEEFGSVAYRGQGPKKEYTCRSCGSMPLRIIAEFAYNELALIELLASFPAVHPEDFFDYFSLRGICANCSHDQIISGIDVQ